MGCTGSKMMIDDEKSGSAMTERFDTRQNLQRNRLAAASKANAAIEAEIREQKRRMDRQIKILLLGAGESGKSTILKQMKLIHTDSGFSPIERERYKRFVYQNVFDYMSQLLNIYNLYKDTQSAIPISCDTQNALQLCQNFIEELEANQQVAGTWSVDTVPPTIVDGMIRLWREDAFLNCYEKGVADNEVSEMLRYFFDNFQRILKPGYMPSDCDILNIRVASTGITETRFNVGEYVYMVFDVGGQRSERKKWIHCFQNVTSVLFLAAISEYDQVLYEDETENRLEESLGLFESICNSRWFEKSSIILFLNKVDLFAKKLPRSPLKNYLPHYNGAPDDVNAAQEYIRGLYLARVHDRHKQVFTHFTCATDTCNVEVVMTSVNATIMVAHMNGMGMM